MARIDDIPFIPDRPGRHGSGLSASGTGAGCLAFRPFQEL